MKYIIIEGDPVSGFVYSGPFETREAAGDYGEKFLAPDWWVAELIGLDELESRREKFVGRIPADASIR
jgi:hypothetical protein